MKKVLLFSFVVLCFASSCSKDDDASNVASGLPLGTVSAKINGQDFHCTQSSAQINEIFVQFFSIGCANSINAETFEALVVMFQLPPELIVEAANYQSFGEDCMPTSSICGSLAYGITNDTDGVTHSSVYENGNSNITITDIDYSIGGFVSGTFSGLVSDDDGDEISISDGQFNLEIEE